MLYFLIPMFLLSPDVLEDFGFVETIHITDDLVISSPYAPEKTVLTDEAMLLTIEDFSTVKAEVEHSAGACNLRLQDLIDKQEETVTGIQARCAERSRALTIELEVATKLNDMLSSNLEESRAAYKTQKWVNLGLVLGGGLLATVVILYQ